MISREKIITVLSASSNPTPAVSNLTPVIWEPATADTAKTLVIDSELKMENGFEKNRMDFWDKLYEKYTGSPLFV